MYAMFMQTSKCKKIWRALYFLKFLISFAISVLRDVFQNYKLPASRPHYRRSCLCRVPATHGEIGIAHGK
jgi:hypothetical protein